MFRHNPANILTTTVRMCQNLIYILPLYHRASLLSNENKAMSHIAALDDMLLHDHENTLLFFTESHVPHPAPNTPDMHYVV